VRLFWASEMTTEMADPGQDPREAPDIASLWSILDLTHARRARQRLVSQTELLIADISRDCPMNFFRDKDGKDHQDQACQCQLGGGKQSSPGGQTSSS
jgi:hypothetical protein